MADEHRDRRAEELLADATAARARGDLTSAQAFANAALALRPGFPGAREVLAAVVDEDGERRQLTVMFCDVVGSTPLSQRNDPEVIRSVLRAYRAVLDDVVTEVEGTIALWIGDGALVYFGHPVPHEDDAWRAVHAGLALLEGVGPVAAAAQADFGIELAIRVAVHTGVVVRAEMGTPSAPDHDAIVGGAPNIAARLQDQARPGTMVISGATYALVHQHFEAIPVGPFALKGIDGLVGAFEVVAEVAAPPAVETLADGSTFVGRRAELDALVGHWLEVEAGGSAAVAVEGDPGIGKTRLTAELRRRVVDSGARTLLVSCSAFHRSTPLFPIRRVVEAAAAIPPGSPPAEVVARVHAALADLGHADAVPIVAELLAVAEEAGLDALDLDPQRRKEVTLAALVDWLAAEATRGPILLVVDDLQWADPTTAELVDRIVGQKAPGLLLAMTVRTGHPVPWSRARVPVIELKPLDEPEVHALVAGLAGVLDYDLVASVVSRADGVPLFVEALANTAGAPEEPRHVDLPTSLRDPLLSRLATAGDDLGLAQLIATIGDDVAVDFLAAVTGRDEADLEASLKALVGVGLLDGDPHLATFRFHHHLMAELAYDTQLLSTRQARHGAVADAIRGGAGTRSSLGRHLEHAGQLGAAIEAYVEAARATQRVGSHPEAMAVLDHAVELLPSIADEQTRIRLELLALECRGFTTTSVLGLGAPQAAADYGRCLELIRTTPQREIDPRVLTGAYYYYSTHGELDVAEELSTQYDEVGRGDDQVAWAASGGRGLLSFLRGRFVDSITQAETFLASDDGRLDRPLPDGYPVPNEPLASTLGTLAACRAIVGDIEGANAAVARLHERVAYLPFPYGPHSAASGLSMAALGWWNLRDEPRATATFAEIRDVASRHGMMSYEVLSALQDALFACRFRDPPASGHAAMMVELWKATGVLVFVPAFGAGVAEAKLREGDADGARQTAEEHLAFGTSIDVHFADAPLLVARGAARLAAGDDAGVEDLRLAATTAAEQGATLYELQARLALARHAAGATDDIARRELSALIDTIPIERTFADLDAARALLATGA